MKTKLAVVVMFAIALVALRVQIAAADEVDELLAAIARAGPEGAGSAEARRACDQLKARGVELLPRLLTAMDTDNVIAANWYRTALDQIVARELRQPQPQFPKALLREYVAGAKHAGRPRRLVLRLLDRIDPEFRSRVIPTLLDDAEFRNDAVALVLAAGDRAKQENNLPLARREYGKAFTHARDGSQITRAADRLQAVGVKANIVEQMGFITRWYLLGPFDSPGTSGFDREFPPQKKVDLAARYEGQGGEPIAWRLFETGDRMGQLNLIQAIKPVKEAVGFAYTELNSAKDRRVQLRCGADDNLTVWLNGEEIFSRRQWLNGTRLDRFTAPATLKQGRNTMLVKICQGPRHVNPAVPNNWSLQLRLCDETGAGVGVVCALPAVKQGDE